MIIIPARLASSRFPNKILCDIFGLPMIVRCAKIAQKVDDVVIACEDSEVQDVAKKYSIKSIMTSKNHKSGTDRIAEACAKLGLKDSEIVINMQGDEPFLEVELLEKIQNLMKNSDAFMGSLCKSIDDKSAMDPNLVKVVLDDRGYAIYFSRAKIPYDRDGVGVEYFGHLGVYGFSARSLKEFCTLAKSPLEDIEKLEQLRAIYHNKSIIMAKVESKSIGVDTKEDLERVLREFA